jgi:RNA polymerase sigma-70 factor (ECF subfamily)
LFELEDVASSEIASMLEIPLGTVASRLRRARAAFQCDADEFPAAIN